MLRTKAKSQQAKVANLAGRVEPGIRKTTHACLCTDIGHTANKHYCTRPSLETPNNRETNYDLLSARLPGNVQGSEPIRITWTGAPRPRSSRRSCPPPTGFLPLRSPGHSHCRPGGRQPSPRPWQTLRPDRQGEGPEPAAKEAQGTEPGQMQRRAEPAAAVSAAEGGQDTRPGAWHYPDLSWPATAPSEVQGPTETFKNNTVAE